MSKFGDVLNNIIIRQPTGRKLYDRIFVVSAYNNVTNWLLEHKKTGEPGVYDLFARGKNYREALEKLLGRLISINHEISEIKLDLIEADRFATERIEQ